MINHKHKFILIHIPKTGGTSIESALCGSDWWKVHPPSKHLTAHIAKKIYAPYWNDYFKFSFVRNPWDRLVSMLKYKHHYKLSLNNQDKIVTTQYFKYFEKIEYDTRFFNLKQFEDFKEKSQSVYMNILGREIDFIGRFENLQEDFNNVCDLLKIKSSKLPHTEKSKNRLHYREYYSEDEKNIVSKKYEKDIDLFKYKF